MTRLFFIPHDQTFLIFDSSQSPEKFSAAINANTWKPPKVVRDWLAQHGNSAMPMKLCASVHGTTVIVTTHSDRVSPHLPRMPAAFSITHRQRQVLLGLMKGQSTKDIATRLSIQPRTVFSHIAALKQRFGTRSRTEIVSLAAEMGILRVKRSSKQ
jgi:DNA-binding CsgD family transcriptional regulator